jgi:hypothetical protein
MFTQFQKETGKLQGNGVNFNVNMNTKNNDYFGISLNANPLNPTTYEPRAQNRYVNPRRIEAL